MANQIANGFVGATAVSRAFLGANEVTFGMLPSNPPVDPSVIWFDDFDYPAGSAFNSADFRYNPTNDHYAEECPSLAKNAYHDGASNLVLRMMREPGGVLNNPPSGHAQKTVYFSGIQLCTFGYGLGWPTPAAQAKHVFLPPFRYECRWMMANVDSCINHASWLQTSNKATSAYIHELDASECGTGSRFSSRNYQHRWQGVDTRNQTIGTLSNLSDWRANYHTVRCDVLEDGPKYYVDDVQIGGQGGPIDLVGGGPDTTGTFGIILQNIFAPPTQYITSFYGGGGTPLVADPGGATGEWYMLVDWIKVTQL